MTRNTARLPAEDWPHRNASQRVEAGGIAWHIQRMGQGPAMLLLHGTGATTHSFRDLMPRLAEQFAVIAVDLPGHGGSSRTKAALTLPGMAAAVASLLEALDIAPDYVIGHSAGVAVALRMALDGRIAPRRIIGLNAALMPFPGTRSFWFPALTKLLFLNPFAAPIVAQRARDPAAIKRLIKGVGSHLDEAGLAYYQALFRNPRHVDATMRMMASWDLHGLRNDMPKLTAPLTLIAGDNDLAVPPRVAEDVKKLLPGTEIIRIEGYGHLLHEEIPRRTADLICDIAAREAAAA